METKPAPAPLEQADQIFRTREYKSALDGYLKAVEAAESERDRSSQVEALAQVARCHSLLHQLDEGETWLERARRAATPEDPQGWSRYLGVRGIFERERGNRDRAKATFIEMYEYCTRQGLHRRAIDAVHHIAIVAPPDEQVAWAHKGIDAAEKAGDEKWLAVLWNNLGATFEDRKQYDSALEAYVKAREFHHKTGDESARLVADWAVGHAYRLVGKNDTAMEWLKKTLVSARERYTKNPGPETAEWVGFCLQDIGEVLLAKEDRDAGLRHLKEARASLVEGGIEKWWAEALKKLDARIDELEQANRSP